MSNPTTTNYGFPKSDPASPDHHASRGWAAELDAALDAIDAQLHAGGGGGGGGNFTTPVTIAPTAGSGDAALTITGDSDGNQALYIVAHGDAATNIVLYAAAGEVDVILNNAAGASAQNAVDADGSSYGLWLDNVGGNALIKASGGELEAYFLSASGVKWDFNTATGSETATDGAGTSVITSIAAGAITILMTPVSGQTVQIVSGPSASIALNGATWTSGTGAPSGTPPSGSFYSRIGGGAMTSLYVYNGSWTAVA